MARLLHVSLAALGLFSCVPTLADEPLRWAADTESGAPFVFQDPKNPERLIGFEKEIIEAIARELGRPATFVQNSWDGLIPGLLRGNYSTLR